MNDLLLPSKGGRASHRQQHCLAEIDLAQRCGVSQDMNRIEGQV